MHLTTDSLTKRYDNFELSIPDLEIEPGTAVGLVGNNGAGKTTFLRLVLDLIRADDGQVHLDGDPVADTFDWKTRTGSYLGPSFLIDFLTPDEYWHFVGQTYELDEATVDERLAQFDDFYVDEPIGETTKYIRDLSTGNKNKAGLIAALLPDRTCWSSMSRSRAWTRGHRFNSKSCCKSDAARRRCSSLATTSGT
jgi:ABC-type multidrug transport system, ATPase component